MFTWPLVRGLTDDLPGDFGDPLLNSWILAWDATHFGRGWWSANIFAPHPLALAYSEHLAAQAALVLPVYRLTENPILCYNLVFLSAFALCGAGMFLLSKELVGDSATAFVAGLAYAFAPYRIASMPHVQVLSSAWMPLVLFGFRRYFVTRRASALGVAGAAWLLQNLSCGYYLLFFAPVVALYVAWELTTRRLWSDARVLAAIALTGFCVVLATIPFLLPYLELRRLGFSPRSLVETRKFSADVYGYLTADPNIRVWGSIAKAWPKPEGALFPGVTVVVMAVAAVLRAAKGVALEDPPARHSQTEREGVRRAIVVVLSIATLIALLLIFDISIRLPGVKITSLSRALTVAAIAWVAALLLSRTVRRTLAGVLCAPAGIFALITIFAIMMSFGPEIRARGRVVLDTNVYALFYRFVPGFDGLRVPARYAMIASLGLAALAALGLDALRRHRPNARAWIAAAAAIIFVEGLAVPIPINQNSTGYARTDLAPLPPLAIDPPPVYATIAALPSSSIVLELPLGEPAFDVRYMFYSTRHWKALVNGYSGGRPEEYERLDQSLQDALIRPQRAWDAVVASGATHVLVHEASYADERGPAISDWIRAQGGRETATAGADRLFALRR